MTKCNKTVYLSMCLLMFVIIILQHYFQRQRGIQRPREREKQEEVRNFSNVEQSFHIDIGNWFNCIFQAFSKEIHRNCAKCLALNQSTPFKYIYFNLISCAFQSFFCCWFFFVFSNDSAKINSILFFFFEEIEGKSRNSLIRWVVDRINEKFTDFHWKLEQ